MFLLLFAAVVFYVVFMPLHCVYCLCFLYCFMLASVFLLFLPFYLCDVMNIVSHAAHPVIGGWMGKRMKYNINKYNINKYNIIYIKNATVHTPPLGIARKICQ